MKILFVNPGRIEAGLDSIIKSPPLALLSIAAMVPEHEATLFDFKVDRYSENAFRKLLKKHEIVAISSMTPQIQSAFEVAQMAKEEGLITILGGYHPTLEPEFCISNPHVDYIVKGEGEHTFKELIDYISNSDSAKPIKDILGISYKDQVGNVVHNGPRPLEMNLDNFPLPRRNLLKGKRYSYLGTKVMLMETSRGCPHNCNFCCIIKMWNDGTNTMRYRTKSLKRIMEELYSIDPVWDFVFFNDDNFTINIKRTDKILDAILKSGLQNRFFFSCQSRVDTFNNHPWLAEKMAKAGFRQVFFGIESVHQQSLDAMGKKTNAEMIRSACKMATDNGISIFGGMIVGFPGETKQMVRENIQFAISLGLDFVQFTPITAFPGTKFFEEMKEKKKISTYNWKYYNLFTPMMGTDQLSREEIYSLVGEAYGKYYMNKDYLKMMFSRALFNPKFNWFKKFAFNWVNQFIFGGYGMLKSMGISGLSRKEPNSVSIKQQMKLRWKQYKLLLKQAKKQGIQLDIERLSSKVN